MLDEKRWTEPHFTFGDYIRWTGDERWELVDGVPHAMTPAPGRLHQKALVGLTLEVGRSLQGGPCELLVAPLDVRLPAGDEADDAILTVVQPDLLVVCDPDKLDDRGCRGAPDWIVEILSPESARRDQLDKRDLYARHGVREYWILHPGDRVLTAYRQDPGERAFAPPEVREARGTAEVAAIPGLQVDWDRVFESI